MEKPTIYIFQAGEADLVIPRGLTATAALLRWLPGGVTPYVWQPGDVGKLQIFSAPVIEGGELLAEFSTAGTAPKLFFDAQDNWLKWRIEKTTTAAWDWVNGFYYVDVAFGVGNERTLLTGLLTLA